MPRTADHQITTGVPIVAPDAAWAAGAAWVSRYLLPLLGAFCTQTAKANLRCLHFGPNGTAEVEAVRAAGHECESAEWNNGWLDADSGAFDVVFGASFGVLAPTGDGRRRLASELSRVVRRPGALLLTLANSRSVIDLSRTAGLLHLPGDSRCAGLAEARQCFIASGLFDEMRLLSLAGHFGWTQIPHPVRALQPWLDRYIAWASDPANPRRYGGPLNPVLNLWIAR